MYRPSQVEKRTSGRCRSMRFRRDRAQIIGQCHLTIMVIVAAQQRRITVKRPTMGRSMSRSRLVSIAPAGKRPAPDPRRANRRTTLPEWARIGLLPIMPLPSARVFQPVRLFLCNPVEKSDRVKPGDNYSRYGRRYLTGCCDTLLPSPKPNPRRQEFF